MRAAFQCSAVTYNDILVEFPNHQYDSFVLGQFRIMDYGQALWCVGLICLVVDEGGEVCLVAGKLNNDELVALLPGQWKQELATKIITVSRKQNGLHVLLSTYCLVDQVAFFHLGKHISRYDCTHRIFVEMVFGPNFCNLLLRAVSQEFNLHYVS
jgi:hypothetical protein